MPAAWGVCSGPNGSADAGPRVEKIGLLRGREPEASYVMLPLGIFAELAAFCLLHNPKVEVALIVFSEHQGAFAIGCAD